MRARVLALTLVLTAGCSWMSEPCPCGRTFERDPWTDEAAYLGSSHAIGAHCVCRCGEDEAVLEDPSVRCDLYEGACTTEAGADADYTCR